MQTKMCPNGHRYDPNIYGDECPLCAQSSQQYSNGPRTHVVTPGPARMPSDGHTHVAQAPQRPAPRPAHTPAAAQPSAEGDTRMLSQSAPTGAASTPHTVIRRPGTAQNPANDRKLVGFLVTYNRHPMGKAFPIYEGRNILGRDRKCDICVPDDNMMSGTHLSILYREVDNKFKFRDEQSSNGTYINKVITDEGELNNYDIIRAGSTIFIFIAIPKI